MSSLMSSLKSLELNFFDELNRNDVLCGRRALLFNLGNVTYRHYVNHNKELYLYCKKHEKIRVSKAIVAAVRGQDPPGRFVEQDLVSGRWYDIGDRKAVEKTSQALREGAPKLRQRLNFAQTGNSYSHSSMSNPANINTPPPVVNSPNPNSDGQMTDDELEIIASRTLSNPFFGAAMGSVVPNCYGQNTDDELIIIASRTLSNPYSNSLYQLQHYNGFNMIAQAADVGQTLNPVGIKTAFPSSVDVSQQRHQPTNHYNFSVGEHSIHFASMGIQNETSSRSLEQAPTRRLPRNLPRPGCLI